MVWQWLETLSKLSCYNLPQSTETPRLDFHARPCHKLGSLSVHLGNNRLKSLYLTINSTWVFYGRWFYFNLREIKKQSRGSSPSLTISKANYEADDQCDNCCSQDKSEMCDLSRISHFFPLCFGSKVPGSLSWLLILLCGKSM